MEKNSLRQKAIKAINDTNFYPKKGRERKEERDAREKRKVWCDMLHNSDRSFADELG